MVDYQVQMRHLIEENNKLKTENNQIKLEKEDLYFNRMRKTPHFMVIIYFSSNNF